MKMNEEERDKKLQDVIWFSPHFRDKVLADPGKTGILYEMVRRKIWNFWELYRENSPMSDHDCLVADIGEDEIEILDEVLKAEGLPSLKDSLEYYFLHEEIEKKKFD